MADVTLKSAEYRIAPQIENIDGRHVSGAAFRRLVPVKASTTVEDGFERSSVEAATAATGPVRGMNGLVDYVKLGQSGFEDFRGGFDRETIPAGVPVQMVQGSEMKVAYRNSDDVKMVAGVAAVGALVTPQTSPDDTAGYFVVTSTAAEAWGVITNISADGDIEVRFSNL